jgi:hypothetical protein
MQAKLLLTHIHQRKRKERQPWNDLLLQPREKTIQTLRFFARFAYHHFIPGDWVFIYFLNSPGDCLLANIRKRTRLNWPFPRVSRSKTYYNY